MAGESEQRGLVFHFLSFRFFIVTKREPSRKAKLNDLPVDHADHAGTSGEMGFIRRVASVSLRDKVRSSAIREELRLEPLLLCLESQSQLRWFRYLVRITGHVQ